MSIMVIAAVWRCDVPYPSDKLVLIALADHAHDDGGGSYPSVERLVKMTGLSERTVRTSLRRLEDGGHIKGTGRCQRTTVYHVHPGGNSVAMKSATRTAKLAMAAPEPSGTFISQQAAPASRRAMENPGKQKGGHPKPLQARTWSGQHNKIGGRRNIAFEMLQCTEKETNNEQS